MDSWTLLLERFVLPPIIPVHSPLPAENDFATLYVNTITHMRAVYRNGAPANFDGIVLKLKGTSQDSTHFPATSTALCWPPATVQIFRPGKVAPAAANAEMCIEATLRVLRAIRRVDPALDLVLQKPPRTVNMVCQCEYPVGMQLNINALRRRYPEHIRGGNKFNIRTMTLSRTPPEPGTTTRTDCSVNIAFSVLNMIINGLRDPDEARAVALMAFSLVQPYLVPKHRAIKRAR